MNQPVTSRHVTCLITALLLALSLYPLLGVAQDVPGFYVSAFGGVPAAPSTSFSEFRPTGPGVGAPPNLVAVWASVLPWVAASAMVGPSSWRWTSAATISGASVVLQSMATFFQRPSF